MSFRSLLFLGLPALAIAAASNVEVYMGELPEDLPLIATIVALSGSATTIHLACPSGVSADECGVSDGIDITAWGTTSFAMTTSYSDDELTFVGTMDCSLYPTPTGNAGGVCVTEFSGSDAENNGIYTRRIGKDSLPTTISIVAGGDLLDTTASATNSRTLDTASLPTQSATSGSTSKSTSGSSSGVATPSGVASPSGHSNSTGNSTDPAEGAAASVHGLSSAFMASVGIVTLSGVFALLL